MLLAFTRAQADVIVVGDVRPGSNRLNWASIGLLWAHSCTHSWASRLPETLLQYRSPIPGPIAARSFSRVLTGRATLMPGLGDLDAEPWSSHGFVWEQLQFHWGVLPTKHFRQLHRDPGCVQRKDAFGFGVGEWHKHHQRRDSAFHWSLDKTGPNITKVVFSESNTTTNPRDFAIATMYLGAPEPRTMVLLGAGLLGLMCISRRFLR